MLVAGMYADQDESQGLFLAHGCGYGLKDCMLAYLGPCSGQDRQFCIVLLGEFAKAALRQQGPMVRDGIQAMAGMLKELASGSESVYAFRICGQAFAGMVCYRPARFSMLH